MARAKTSNDAPVPDELTVLVVSDLHAYDVVDKESAGPPSLLCTMSPESDGSRHPLTALFERAGREPRIAADIVVCCGDMGDRARPAAIKYVWDKLNVLKDKVGADLLLVTAGNHDVDSRHKYNSYDAKGVLQSLVPLFPLTEPVLSDRYWSRNYVLLTRPGCRIVLLNSSAYHGSSREQEYEHGRISPLTVEALRRDLAEGTAPAVNLLVCHHHPLRHRDIEDDDYSVMEGGDKLIDVLGSGQLGTWMIVHGHKHHPRICYGPGGSSAPVVFSSGSLAATLYPALQGNARNQFHLIKFHIGLSRQLGLGLAGTFSSWDFAFGTGWLPAERASGLPASGGFGCRRDIASLVRDVERTYTRRGQPYLEWAEVLGAVQDARFLLPQDVYLLLERLEGQFGIGTLFDKDGTPAQIGRRTTHVHDL
jgi:predicted MPP superfamily phosphohydrolase